MPIISEKTRILLKLFTPQRRKPDPRHAVSTQDRDLSGKTVVFTGGTDGMGRVAVDMLHAMGAHVVILGRDVKKANELLNALNAKEGAGSASFELCDLASLQSVKDCSERILASQKKIDVLVNCAGVNAMSKKTTADGYAMNWSVNYLAPVLLTRLTLDRLQASAPARIVNLTTDTGYLDHIDLDAMATEPDLGFEESYAASKLAFEMFSVDLAQDLAERGVTVNLQHPGYIRSNLLRNLTGAERVMQGVMRVMASPTVVGADRIVRLVASSKFSGVTGILVAEDEPRPLHVDARDDEKRKRLREITNKVLARWS